MGKIGIALSDEGIMSEFIEERARVIRSMASTADPFTSSVSWRWLKNMRANSGRHHGRFARSKHRRGFLLWDRGKHAQKQMKQWHAIQNKTANTLCY
jgi:hypothetical protein